MIDTTAATAELFAALAEAQADVENATKNAKNLHFKNQYADLAEVLNTVRPVFARHGLSIVQATGFSGSVVSVETLIAHKSGGRISSVAACVPAKTDAQGIGSATTYLRRYGLAAMTGVAQEDDDGNSAAHNHRPEPVEDDTPSPADKFLTSIDAAQTLEQLREIKAAIGMANIGGAARARVVAAWNAKKAEMQVNGD